MFCHKRRYRLNNRRIRVFSSLEGETERETANQIDVLAKQGRQSELVIKLAICFSKCGN